QLFPNGTDDETTQQKFICSIDGSNEFTSLYCEWRRGHFRQVGLKRFHKVPQELACHYGEVGHLLPVRPEHLGRHSRLAIAGIGSGEEVLPLQLGAVVQALEPPVGLALQVLKQHAFGGVALRVQEVPVGVHPPQHPPAVGDLAVCLGDEAEVRGREVHGPRHPLELRALELVHVRERLVQRLAVGRPPLWYRYLSSDALACLRRAATSSSSSASSACCCCCCCCWRRRRESKREQPLWSFQGSRQSQQNWWRQGSRQVMWLQPWFFSMGRRHSGQCLVLASNQLAVSASEEFLASNQLAVSASEEFLARTLPHGTGRCASSAQRKQNWWRQGARQVMWLQLWFFSMGRRHLGQCLVLARTQLAVSASDEFLASHARTVLHGTGQCASSLQSQQKPCPHAQNTSAGAAPSPSRTSTARAHPGAGHHLIPPPPSSTYDRRQKCAYRSLQSSSEPAAARTSSTSSRTTGAAQAGSGHRSATQHAPSPTAARTYPRQHPSQ
ncbi:LOW QUALITY PROTEIN: hypothetical protein U9M48_001272, partial [Paspalum notatum var. saurae]